MALGEISAILNGLDAAVFVIDKNRNILLANSAATMLFGSGWEGENFVRAVRHPDCLRSIESVLQGDAKSQISISLLNPVKTTYRVTVASLFAKTTPAPAAVISFENISHIGEAEQMRSDFVANVSHELRSPLTALSGFIETLKGPAKDDKAARERFLDTMDREARRMNRLIEDLLSLSKVEVDEHVRPTGSVDILAVLEQVTTVLSPLLVKENKKVRLEKSVHVPVLVTGDEDQLIEVFQNLIENALKYSHAETDVIVTFSQVNGMSETSERLLEVAIQDQGPGIPSRHIPRLTERFYRVDNSRSRDKGGTGLGLAIVKHIINRHRGRLQIKSEVGVGSTFTVILPVARSPIPAPSSTTVI